MKMEKIKQIGYGSYSKVYLCKNYRGLCFVNKCIENQEEITTYVSNELFILEKLHHPNIIRYIFHEHISPVVNIYFEYGGVSLIECLEPFNVKSILKQILEAVKYLHGSLIAHLDISTRNVLIYKGDVKLIDFGMATPFNMKILENVCTVSFSSPEMLLGIYDYFPATDLWSVGCVFYYLLTCTHLWLNKDPDKQLIDIFDKLGHGENYKYSKKWDIRYNDYNYKHPLMFADSNIQDLLNKLLSVNYGERITAVGALNHKYFKN